jgi:hypothetical protein
MVTKPALLILLCCSIVQIANAQELGATRNLTRITHRVMRYYEAISTKPPGEHRVQRVESLTDYCSGSAGSTVGKPWTSPFTSIYSSVWKNYEFDETHIAPIGSYLKIVDSYEHSTYALSGPQSLKPASETVSGEIFMQVFEIAPGIWWCDWQPFVLARQERKWEYRWTKCSIETTPPPSGGDDGPGLG